MSKTFSIALVGCGALSELYYSPALRALQASVPLQVTVIVDPSAPRREVLQKAFPQARALTAIGELRPGEAEIAIVASPQKFHAEQTIALLATGLHVLCEKPMASTAGEARRMVAASHQHKRHLAVGLFRRFFPSTRLVHQLVTGGALGKARSFEWVEGGVFNWPAATPSFFQKASSPGGVFSDVGTHVLDLLLSWFGTPDQVDYADDAMGGIEANALLKLGFSGGITGSVRLSRDTALKNGTRIHFERGWVGFSGASADNVTLVLDGSDLALKAGLHRDVPGQIVPDAATAAATYSQAFMAQITNLCAAVRGTESVLVTGEDAARGLDLIERCYAQRALLAMPWMTAGELETARSLQTASPVSTS